MKNNTGRINVIIVSDSQKNLGYLNEKTGAIPELSVKGVYHNVEDALMAISLHQPELILMQGEISTLSGKHLYDLLTPAEQRRCVLAGDLQINGHILETPNICFQIKDLDDTKEWRHLREKILHPVSDRNHMYGKEPNAKIILKSKDKFVFTQKHLIKYIKQKQDKTDIHYSGGKISVEEDIRAICEYHHLENLRALGHNLRVNTDRIEALHVISNGCSEIEFSDGSLLLMDDHQTSELMKWLMSETQKS